MSFLSKAVKKIFSFGKKIWGGIKKAFGNKWFRAAFAIGMTLFASGTGSEGFDGFGAARDAALADGSSTVGAFFSAVGQTIAAGYSNIAESTGELFGVGAAVGSIPGEGPGISETGTTGVITVGPSEEPEKKGLLGRLLGTLFEDSERGSFMRSSIAGGISFWAKQKEIDKAERRRNNATVAGGKAFGGSADLPPGFIRKPIVNAGIKGSSARELSVQEGQGQGSAGIPPSRTLEAPLLGEATQLTALPGLGDLLDRNLRQGTRGSPLLGAA